MLSADNPCKQLGPSSVPTFGGAWSGSKLFDTNGISEDFFFELDDFGKKNSAEAMQKKKKKNHS